MKAKLKFDQIRKTENPNASLTKLLVLPVLCGTIKRSHNKSFYVNIFNAW